MVSRRISTILTLLCALAMVASLGLVVQTKGDRKSQPARHELARGLAGSVNDLADRADALSQATDLGEVREARQRLAHAVLAFDQDLLALAGLARGVPDAAAVAEIQAIWRELGLELADLAAGDYAASSAAGRQTLASLREEVPALRNHLQTVTTALHGNDQRATRVGSLATTAAVILGCLTLFGALMAAWLRRAPAAVPAPTAAPRAEPSAADAEAPWPFEHAAPVSSARPRTTAPVRPAPRLHPQGDLGMAGAAVDRVSVDMLTIARSAERMQHAVDSVTAALQGMLFSLNELAQDTHEGSRIARTANNAAVYAADTARELLETAREMGDVVTRVRSLAARSQEIAGRIESEAAATGATGEAFTSVVAQEVRQLAMATDDSTAHIESAVSGILTSQRQYEEAIGQIIKNVGMVRKVAANLGALMLEPPARVQPGPAYQPPPAPQAAPPVAVPQAATPPPPPPPPVPPVSVAPPTAVVEDVPDQVLELDAISPEEAARIEELTAVTDNLLDELAEVAAESSAGLAPKPAAAPTATPTPAPPPEPSASAAEKTPASKPTPAPSGSNGNVFMLNRSKPAGARGAAATQPTPAAEAAPEPAPQPEPEPQPEPAPPPPPVAPAAAAPAPEPPVEELTADEAEEALDELEQEPVGAGAPAKPRTVPTGASGNIFLLNKPKKKD